MNQLEEARIEIDCIDRAMAELFAQRMAVAAKIAAYKKEHGLPVLDSSREAAVLQKNSAYLNDPALLEPYQDFLKHLMRLSREYQQKLLSL